jgi:hypothetical protein
MAPVGPDVLEWMFAAAIEAALPGHCLPPHLPPRRKAAPS